MISLLIIKNKLIQVFEVLAQQIKLDALLQRAQNHLERKAYIFVQNGETESGMRIK